MKKIILITVFCILAAGSISAITGKVTASLDYSFNDKWYRTQGTSIPLLSEDNEVYKNQNFFLYLFFSQYKPDTTGKINVTYDLSIYRPDSSLYFSNKEVQAGSYIISNPDYILLAATNLRVSFENEDPFGVYRISIDIKDNNTDLKETVETTIELIPFERDSSIVNDSLMSEWMMTYYQHPSPEKAINAFIQFSKSPLRDNTAALSYSFFFELFRNNRFLLSELKKEYNFVSDIAKNDILRMLAFTKDEDIAFLGSLDKSEEYTYKNNVGGDSVLYFPLITSPVHLDMLWARFFASGRFLVIKQLAEALSMAEFKGALIKFEESGNDPNLEREAVMDAAYQSLTWSLDANLKSHKLVQDYLTFIYNKEEMPEIVKKELEIILTK